MAQTAREASLARRQALSTAGKAAISGSSDRIRTAPGTATTTSAAATSVAPTASYTPAPAQSGGNARDAALARRIAMSQGGKRAVASTDRVRTAPGTTTTATPSATPATTEAKKDCGCGCGGKKGGCGDREATTVDTSAASTPMVTTPTVTPTVKVAQNSTRTAALSRRKAMSAKGKSALKGGTVSQASAARAANPNISSRELAQALREERSVKGKCDKGQSCKTAATGPGRHRKAQAAAQDADWKVGATETASGQTVTGTMVDRTNDVTGNEYSTCREVTGTEYMGADVFKSFCQSDAKPGFNRVSVTTTGTGNSVTGNKVGRSSRVTGDEPGTCKNVTGTEYVSADQAQKYCGTSTGPAPSKFSIAETMKGKKVSGNNAGTSGKVTGNESGADIQLTGTQYMQKGEDKAPAKVNVSQTLRGGAVTGQHIGRSEKVTGDEPGSCRNVTGDDYVGAEQYSSFCKSAPTPKDRKVGMSATLMGKSVTGTMTDRSNIVTGNEAGTCKALTGTPYAGHEQTEAFCPAPDKAMAMARARKGTTNVGPSMTGIQPGINGVMTGNAKGACETLPGTPYVGVDQAAEACPATAATPASADFPQQLSGGQPWGEFSVTLPSGGAQQGAGIGNVTGSVYESGHITGPFGMATGKVTGTEQARFGSTDVAMPEPVPATAAMVAGRVKSRITGEGQDAGQKITGDDWERNEAVTGTEGRSATRRNPTLRGPMMSMAAENKRNEELEVPMSKVTGSSGNTEKGSLITYSGGARG